MLKRFSSILCFVAILFVATTAFAADYTFDSAGVKIHYIVEGQGEPVILIHGYAASAITNWGTPGVIKKLAENYQVIALDNRGHGQSEKPHDAAAYGPVMFEDVLRLMDH